MYENQKEIKVQTPKIETESKNETKTENIKKPTRIPQAGINVVECITIILIAIIVIAIIFIRVNKK